MMKFAAMPRALKPWHRRRGWESIERHQFFLLLKNCAKHLPWLTPFSTTLGGRRVFGNFTYIVEPVINLRKNSQRTSKSCDSSLWFSDA
jgi:hypothetical protein